MRMPEVKIPEFKLPEFKIPDIPKVPVPNATEIANEAATSFMDTILLKLGEGFQKLIVEFMAISTELCLIAGLVGAILYIFGCKKTKNYPMIAFAIHLIIRIIGGVLLGV